MKSLVFATALLAAVSIQAQPSPAAPVISQTNQAAGTGTVLTNKAGQTFSVEQLAAQLRSLRGNIESALPMLAAFNESASATQNKSLTGRLTDIVSHELNKGGQTNSGGFNSVVGALRGLINTNNAATDTSDARAAQQLVALQNQLQPVLKSLQDLNVQGTAASGQPSTSTSTNLTPTGH